MISLILFLFINYYVSPSFHTNSKSPMIVKNPKNAEQNERVLLNKIFYIKYAYTGV